MLREAVQEQVWEFFLRYKNGNSSCDVVTIGDLYADLFMFGKPDGVQTVRKVDFLKVIPRMKAHFASLGVADTRLETVDVSTLDSKYLLATVGWAITLENAIGSKQVQASATYILMRGVGDTLTIVFQIDHQDLAGVIRAQQSVQ